MIYNGRICAKMQEDDCSSPTWSLILTLKPSLNPNTNPDPVYPTHPIMLKPGPNCNPNSNSNPNHDGSYSLPSAGLPALHTTWFCTQPFLLV